MPAVCIYFHAHQPNRLKQYTFFGIGNDHFYEDDDLNQTVCKTVANKSYLPTSELFLKLLQKYPGQFKIGLSMTGTLIEQLEYHAPTVLDLTKKMIDTGGVEILSEPFYNSLACIYSTEEFIRQIKLEEKKLFSLFGVSPKVFRNTGMIHTNAIAKEVEKLGYTGILTEPVEHSLFDRSENVLYRSPYTKNLKILLRNVGLSLDISSRFNQESWEEYPLTAEKFADWIAKSKGDLVNIFLNYEAIGEHLEAESGIFDFFEALPQALIDRGIECVTPSEAIERYQTHGVYDVQAPISWADTAIGTSAWAGNSMQEEALSKTYALEKTVLNSHNDDLIHIWSKLQTSDHFYYMSTTAFEDGKTQEDLSPYDSPYSGYIYFMNALADLEITCAQQARPKPELLSQILHDDLTRIQGITSEDIEKLHELSIFTYEDLFNLMVHYKPGLEDFFEKAKYYKWMQQGDRLAQETRTASKLGILKDDHYLNGFEHEIKSRLSYFKTVLNEIETHSGSLYDFSNLHDFLGFHYDKKAKGWYYREWAPSAKALYLIGDFNNWDRGSHPMARRKDGYWECFLPDTKDGKVLSHLDTVKVNVVGENGLRDRIPATIRRAVQDEVTKDFKGQIWNPKQAFKWTDQKFSPKNIDSLLIYECHIGMASEEEKVGSYREFADLILPQVIENGYTCLQIMAIMEHPYYGSFGYHVSNYFAPSSRFGEPEDLKYLINKAHKNGIAVLIDIVHSHAVKNEAEGLNNFDGSGHQYFHIGGRGYHSGWDSKLFDYGKKEVKQFLLSNLRYWMEEFHFDGFRFDGVTSMMYLHHGEFVSFDSYEKYFREGVDWDAIVYLQLATKLVHDINPDAILIAEDMSGMPGLCRKIEEGGIGFDYRLGMGIPDYWIKLLKHVPDENWNVHDIWHTLTNRRFKEKTIAYAESHDQALVGDKTLAFRLMDKEMYFHMGKEDQNVIIDRGIALHKMIRLITASLGGEGYLNFMGNEFGHPEWIDFPREGNDWSYKYARRQWSLIKDENLRYQFLRKFDISLVQLIKDFNLYEDAPSRKLNMDEQNQTIIFERRGLIFIFNFSSQNSIPDYEFQVPSHGNYSVILNSDHKGYGGFARTDGQNEYHTVLKNKVPFLKMYITNRTAFVLKKIES